MAIDKNPNAPGFKYADVSINKSTYDAEEIIIELNQLCDYCNWLGVLNRSSGLPVITAATICNYYKLPSMPIESANIVVNKDLLHSFCLNHKIQMVNHLVKIV